MKEILDQILRQIVDERNLLGTPDRWTPLQDLFRKDIMAAFARSELDSGEACLALREVARPLGEPAQTIAFPAPFK